MYFSFQLPDNKTAIEAMEKGMNAKAVSIELFPGNEDGHIFKPTEKAKLVGLLDYPQFNGEIITITSIRQNGSYGKAYYFSTENEELAYVLNWTYEYRLEKIPA